IIKNRLYDNKILSLFVKEIKDNIIALNKENNIKDILDIKLYEYLDIRIQTISVIPYISLWKYKYNFYNEVIDKKIKYICAIIQSLSNDLFSVERDKNKTFNSVLVVEKQNSISREKAIEHVLELHRRYCNKFKEIIEQNNLKDEPYINFIKSCTIGNLESMKLISDRYHMNIPIY